MSDRFTLSQERQFARLTGLKAEVAEMDLIPKPCQLLASQLNELLVFGERMIRQARALKEELEKQP